MVAKMSLRKNTDICTKTVVLRNMSHLEICLVYNQPQKLEFIQGISSQTDKSNLALVKV